MYSSTSSQRNTVSTVYSFHLQRSQIGSNPGKVAHLRIPGNTMIILNSAQAATDLLDKRSAIYSDRPQSDVFMLYVILFYLLAPRGVLIFPDLCSMGWKHNLGFLPYGKRLQKHRKMFNEYFNQEKCENYLPHQALEASRLIRNLLFKPENFDDHLNRYQISPSSLLFLIDMYIITRFSTAVILRIGHGREIISDDDPYLKIMSDVTYSVTHCAAPMSNLVDLLPISCVAVHVPFSYRIKLN